MRSRLRVGCCSSLILFFVSHAMCRSLSWCLTQFQPNFNCRVEGLILEYVGIQRSLWLSEWLQGTHVLWLQTKPKSSLLHRRADICLVIAKCGAVHFVQTSFQKSCAFFRCNIANLSRAAVFFLERRGNIDCCILLCAVKKNVMSVLKLKMCRFSGGSNLVFDLFLCQSFGPPDWHTFCDQVNSK